MYFTKYVIHKNYRKLNILMINSYSLFKNDGFNDLLTQR